MIRALLSIGWIYISRGHMGFMTYEKVITEKRDKLNKTCSLYKQLNERQQLFTNAILQLISFINQEDRESYLNSFDNLTKLSREIEFLKNELGKV